MLELIVLVWFLECSQPSSSLRVEFDFAQKQGARLLACRKTCLPTKTFYPESFADNFCLVLVLTLHNTSFDSSI